MSEEQSKTTGAAFFLGRFEHALDPKHRLTIPSGWRDLMGDPKYVFVLPDPTERCLNIISQAEMQERLGKLHEKSLFDPKLTKALRAIGENSEQLPLDVQGRIRISERLLAFAEIKSKVAFIGAVNRMQLWAADESKPTPEIDQEAFGDAISALMI